MCVVQIIRRTNCNIIDRLFFIGPPELFQMPVESLKLGKKIRIRKIGIKNANRIAFVQCGDKNIAGIP